MLDNSKCYRERNKRDQSLGAGIQIPVLNVVWEASLKTQLVKGFKEVKE